MTTLRDLNRAVQSYPFSSVEFAQAVREWIGAATERMEPASEPAQVECPNCGQAVPHAFDHVTGWANGGAKLYICKPASEGGKVCPICLQPGEHYKGWKNGGFDCPTNLEPASAPDKVECWHCKERVVHNLDHWLSDGIGANGKYTCKPAQPETKVECPNCGVGGNHYLGMFNSGTQIVYSCDPKPAQPEPAANSAQAINARAEAAFAEATRLKTVAAVYIDSPGGQRNRVLTDETDKPVTADTFATDRAIGAQVADAGAVEPVAAEMFPAMRAFLDAFPGQRTIGQWHAADNELKAALRSQAAPAVAMTDELRKVLDHAARCAALLYMKATTPEHDEECERIDKDIAAVRAQAAEAGNVPIDEIRSITEIVKRTHCDSRSTRKIEAWLDAAEGRK